VSFRTGHPGFFGEPSKFYVILPFRHLRAFGYGLLFISLGTFLPGLCAAQEPVPPPPAAPSAQSQPGAAARESSNKQQSRIPPFLILGTVFNERGYAFPGVKVRIRRKGEKKFLYEVYTDYRGEFAVRVPDNIEYEVVVVQKKYTEQSQVVAAKIEDVQKRLSFKLEPMTPAKSGASK
jgi:hypothetical protein